MLRCLHYQVRVTQLSIYTIYYEKLITTKAEQHISSTSKPLAHQRLSPITTIRNKEATYSGPNNSFTALRLDEKLVYGLAAHVGHPDGGLRPLPLARWHDLYILCFT